MKQLAVQVLLIVGTLAVSWRLLLGYGQRAQALRRIGLLLFAAFAVWSILDPGVWTRLASMVGIGRGADLILYGLVVAFFSFVVTTFKRFREMEIRYTRLARRIAIDEAAPPTRRPAVTAAATPAATPAPTPATTTATTTAATPSSDDGNTPGNAPAPESGAPHDAA